MKSEKNSTQHTQLDEFQLPGADIIPTSPVISGGQGIETGNAPGTLPNGEVDLEGAMAKADLFKLSHYSYKLFKKIEDEDQLEAWVQAKITKAADYIASVYHYLEYEMKISEYGKKLESSDMYNESEKKVLRNKLNEGRSVLRTLKIVQASKLSESKFDPKKFKADIDKKAEKTNEEIKLAEAKPSAGLSKAKKSAVVKKAEKGGDIGKPGKNFDKVAKKAGGGEKGKKIAAAAMWKNIKETTEMAVGEGVYGEEAQLDELNLKPWEKKRPFSKVGYKAVADRQESKKKKAVDDIDAADDAGDNAGVDKGNAEWMAANKRKGAAERKANLAKNEGFMDDKNKGAEVSARNIGKAVGNLAQIPGNAKNAYDTAKNAISSAATNFSQGYDASKPDATPSQGAMPVGKASKPAGKPEEYRIVKESADLTRIKEFLTRLNG